MATMFSRHPTKFDLLRDFYSDSTDGGNRTELSVAHEVINGKGIEGQYKDMIDLCRRRINQALRILVEKYVCSIYQ